MWTLDNVQRTVYDMYLYAKEHNAPLLSDFSSSLEVGKDFWYYYLENYEMFDRMFALMYKNFRYFDQDVEGENSVQEVYENFSDSVKGFLMLNEKKYLNLYQMYLIKDMSPVDDFNITETKEGSKGYEREYVSGSRIDTSNESSGQRTDTSINQVMAYNSNTFNDESKSTDTKGAQTNINNITKGEQTDTDESTMNETHTINTKGYKENPSKNLKKYKEVWDSYSFYSDIFTDICKNFLLV